MGELQKGGRNIKDRLGRGIRTVEFELLRFFGNCIHQKIKVGKVKNGITWGEKGDREQVFSFQATEEIGSPKAFWKGRQPGKMQKL